MALLVGTKAPDFKLSDAYGKVYTLSSFAKSWTVLYFYPKDNTPGCTLEARDFTNHSQAFSTHGIKVVGISGGDNVSKQNFCNTHHLTIPLLSDTDFSVAKKYDSYGKSTFFGKEIIGVLRTTYIIDDTGKIAKVYEKVNPLGHAKQVSADIAKLRANASMSGRTVHAFRGGLQ